MTFKSLSSRQLILTAAISISLLACGKSDEAPPGAAPAQKNVVQGEAPKVAPSAFESWLGQWNGPEGTFLKLSRRGDQFEVEIQTLDGPSTYVGTANVDRIEFERTGGRQSIRATDGKATGMKWLLDKQNCLTINFGEGYCRD